jgi:GMP synthase (glutamine-hydrolysing)
VINTLVEVNEKVLKEIAEEMRIRKTEDVFLMFSLGSQFDHLIKQIIEEIGCFCLVADPSRVTAEDVKKVAPRGIILSGGPVSMYEDPPEFDDVIFDLGIPVLGICLGFQKWASHIGCSVVRSEKREFGTHEFLTMLTSQLFDGCEIRMPVLQNHGDKIEPAGGANLKVLGHTENAPTAAAQCGHLWGVQFHPEVAETKYGKKIFENFCYKICGAKKSLAVIKAGQQKIAELREKIGDKKVLLALSGGSDSSTVAYLLNAAMRNPGQLGAVYIKGIDRPDDEACVIEHFGHHSWIKLKIVDATEKFLQVLAGKTKMHEKRVAMRSVYKEILEQEAKDFGASFIAQGTLYTDISESGSGYDSGAKKAQIKLHHNVNLGFSVEELTPLSDCVKDTGRNIGRSIGVSAILLTRHPFPGPGLVVRIEGEVTAERLRIARLIDGIYIEELRKHKLYNTVWQAGAVVTQSIVTCTKGDSNANGIVVRLWAVWSVNGFTAQAAELPYPFIKRVAQRITNEVREVGSVDYRISDKPPATIECG